MSPRTNSCHCIVSAVIPTHTSLQRDNKICCKTGVLCYLRFKFKIKKERTNKPHHLEYINNTRT